MFPAERAISEPAQVGGHPGIGDEPEHAAEHWALTVLLVGERHLEAHFPGRIVGRQHRQRNALHGRGALDVRPNRPVLRCVAAEGVLGAVVEAAQPRRVFEAERREDLTEHRRLRLQFTGRSLEPRGQHASVPDLEQHPPPDRRPVQHRRQVHGDTVTRLLRPGLHARLGLAQQPDDLLGDPAQRQPGIHGEEPDRRTGHQGRVRADDNAPWRLPHLPAGGMLQRQPVPQIPVDGPLSHGCPLSPASRDTRTRLRS